MFLYYCFEIIAAVNGFECGQGLFTTTLTKWEEKADHRRVVWKPVAPGTSRRN